MELNEARAKVIFLQEEQRKQMIFPLTPPTNY
jgi:hypothetical protein